LSALRVRNPADAQETAHDTGQHPLLMRIHEFPRIGRNPPPDALL
jgi:hypothetical protein